MVEYLGLEGATVSNPAIKRAQEYQKLLFAYISDPLYSDFGYQRIANFPVVAETLGWCEGCISHFRISLLSHALIAHPPHQKT